MANRETRRREKMGKERPTVLNEENGISNVVKTIAIVVSIFIIFYIITSVAVNMPKKKVDNTNLNVHIQYEEITAESTFKMNYDEYFVLFYDFKSPDAKLYETIINDNKDKAKIFKVDLAKGFNTPYISETGNPKVNSLNTLKIKGSTIIKINKGVNVGYGEGIEAILSILK